MVERDGSIVSLKLYILAVLPLPSRVDQLVFAELPGKCRFFDSFVAENCALPFRVELNLTAVAQLCRTHSRRLIDAPQGGRMHHFAGLSKLRCSRWRSLRSPARRCVVAFICVPGQCRIPVSS